MGTNYAAWGSGITIGTTPKTLEVRGTVADYNATDGDYIEIGFAQDTVPSAANQDAHGVSVSSYNVWSDRSAAGHDVYTTDWCNGYLLNDMTQVQQLP